MYQTVFSPVEVLRQRMLALPSLLKLWGLAVK